MKKTQHYGLCQWDAEDRILREDFNSDNEKIDGAIADANPLQDLGTVVLEQNGSELNLDLSGVDWSRYWEVRVYFELAGTQYDTVAVSVNKDQEHYFNSLGNSSSYLVSFRLNEQKLQGCIRLCHSEGGIAGFLETFNGDKRASSDYGSYYNTAAESNFSSLDFFVSGKLKAGSTAWLCGIKRI